MNTPFRKAVIVALGASYLCMHAPHARGEDKPADAKPKHDAKKPTAASLVADMGKSVAFIAHAAKDKISVKSKEARPFWSALRDCSKAVDQLEAGVKANDENTLKGLDALGVSVHQLAAAWGVLSGSHEGVEVAPGLKSLSKSYETFLFHFGPSVARKKMGGEVTEAEKAQLVAARAEVKSIKAQLQTIESKAKPKSYQQRFVHDIVGLCDETDKVTGNDLNAYCAYLFQYNRLKYTALAYNSLVDDWFPDFSKDWDTVVKEKKTPGAGEFSETAVTYYKDWKYSGQPVHKAGDYYEVTACVSVITESEEATYESYTESYSEETATEESAEELAQVTEEVSIDEDDHESFADESDGTDIDESMEDGSADEDDGGGEDDGGDEDQ